MFSGELRVMIFFFHSVLKRKARRLAIQGILVGGVFVDDPVKMKEVFNFYYQSMFSKQHFRWPVIHSNHFRSLLDSQVQFLRAPFRMIRSDERCEIVAQQKPRILMVFPLDSSSITMILWLMMRWILLCISITNYLF